MDLGIDKSSSAELSEAINSMFKWYRDSVVCYAFIADAVPDPQVYSSGPHAWHKWKKSFTSSRWFTRGWTLQELIAPNYVEFYDCNWKFFTSKAAITKELANITQINESALNSFYDPAQYTAAERLVWASKRQTTRIEDRAYSLLGIFNVNLPLLYGEGSNAFRRLQEEILRNLDDMTLLMWDHSPPYHVSSFLPPHIFNTGRPLATSPDDFAKPVCDFHSPAQTFDAARHVLNCSIRPADCTHCSLLETIGINKHTFSQRRPPFVTSSGTFYTLPVAEFPKSIKLCFTTGGAQDFATHLGLLAYGTSTPSHLICFGLCDLQPDVRVRKGPIKYQIPYFAKLVRLNEADFRHSGINFKETEIVIAFPSSPLSDPRRAWNGEVTILIETGRRVGPTNDTVHSFNAKQWSGGIQRNPPNPPCWGSPPIVLLFQWNGASIFVVLGFKVNSLTPWCAFLPRGTGKQTPELIAKDFERLNSRVAWRKVASSYSCGIEIRERPLNCLKQQHNKSLPDKSSSVYSLHIQVPDVVKQPRFVKSITLAKVAPTTYSVV